jgi:hypothetical protein
MPLQNPQQEDDWLVAAVTITPGFETSGDPYQGVSGDFDGMGISCGALQWNIGKNSLQPMAKGAGEAVVRRTMPVLGGQMWQACSGTVSSGLAIVRGLQWQKNTKLTPLGRSELRALMGSPEMRIQQDLVIAKKADRAYELAADWATQRDGTVPSRRLLCWFFDMVTQNGGMEGVTPTSVKKFIDTNNPDRVDDLICDFLVSRSGNSGHINDAHKNALLWRNAADGEKLELLCMSYLRSQTALPKWSHVVLNRKGAIAMGKGWVNSSLHDFSAQGL